MNNRIYEVRKHYALSQKDFSAKLNLTPNYISLLETGKRVPSDRTISELCHIFLVNEHWLRTGEGSPYLEQSSSIKIERFMNDALQEDAFTLQKCFLRALLQATPEELKALYAFAHRLAEDCNNNAEISLRKN